jgi:hypothetical protein
MKVTKRILRDMIESELLNERVGQRIDVRSNKGQIRRLRRQVDNGNQTAFNRQWRNEFMNLDASDFSNEKYGERLQSTTNAAVSKGWLEGSNGVFSLSAGMSSAGTVVIDDSGSSETPAQSYTASSGDIHTLDYLLSGGSVLKFGSSGSKVTALQNILNARLQSHGKEDRLIEVTGTFDSATKTAVETMQGVYGIQVDGIVGRQTWTALKSDGAESASVTPGAERAPADGAATAEEEAAAAAAAASPAERPEKPGPMFIWDRDKNVWYAYHNHYYKDETPQDSIYQLWIVKDGEDFHVKMDSGDTWANVTQSDIDSLETQAMMDAAAAEVDVIAPDPDEADEAAVGDEVEVEELALENRSYSLARVMLLEFSAAATRTDNHPENTERDEVGRGDPILTLEEQEAVITARLQAFNNDIQGYGRVLAKEGNKGRFTDSDEDAALQALAAFNQVAEGLYDELSDKVAEFKRAGGDITRLKTPSQLLARSTGWGTVDNMIEKLDGFLAREEYGSMMITVKRNNFSLIEKAREVVASADPGADPEEITRVNNELDVLMQAIKPVALIIAANSYDPNDTAGWRIAQVAAGLAVVAGTVFTGGALAGAGAFGTTAATAAAGSGALTLGGGTFGAAGAAAASASTGGILASTAAGLGAGTTALGGAAMTGAGISGAGYAATNAAALGALGLGSGTTAAGLAAGGTALAAGGYGAIKAGSFLGDGADEDAVMQQLETFSAIALQFYQNNAKSIVDNQISVKTPSQYLLDIYNRNVQEDDVASTIDGLADQMDEFLAGGNYDDMVTILGQNNEPYRQFSSAVNESFTFDRFTKLAGLLKG